MTIKDIQKKNEGFQRRASGMVDMVPNGGLLDAITALVRSMRAIDKCLQKMLHPSSDTRFKYIHSILEEEMDETVYLLDRLESRNRDLKLPALERVLREGFDLLAIYSMCVDQIICNQIGKYSKGDEELF